MEMNTNPFLMHPDDVYEWQLPNHPCWEDARRMKEHRRRVELANNGGTPPEFASFSVRILFLFIIIVCIIILYRQMGILLFRRGGE